MGTNPFRSKSGLFFVFSLFPQNPGSFFCVSQAEICASLEQLQCSVVITAANSPATSAATAAAAKLKLRLLLLHEERFSGRRRPLAPETNTCLFARFFGLKGV